MTKSGKVDITIYRDGYGGVRIPAELLSDDGVEFVGDEGTISNPTFAGTFTQPSGTYDEPTLSFSVVLPNAKYLKSLYPNLHTDSNDRPSIAGQTIFGGDDCTVREPAKVVVHWTCDQNSDDDWYAPNVLLSNNFSATITPTDPLTIAITGHIQPSSELNGGLIRIGTGDLDEPTLFDVATGEYEPITS